MADRITDYALRKHLDMPFSQARREVVDALLKEGFGVLTDVDPNDIDKFTVLLK